MVTPSLSHLDDLAEKHGSEVPPMAWPTLARTAGRLPGSRFRDDHARLATGGAMGADELIECARSGKLTRAVDFDPRGLAWFGQLAASEFESPTHVADTVAIFEFAYRIGGRRALARDLDTVWVQSLSLAGRLDEFRRALRRGDANPSAWWAAAVDAEHPGEVTATAFEWLEKLNKPFTVAQLEPLTFTEGAQAPFDRVHAVAEPVADRSGPLVTVIVPVYNPGESLRTTVASLVAQTWQNLEILLCDDASTTGADLFAELEAIDSRIRHVRSPRNGGTYAARNLGVGLAAGEYVTFNDADDWSHPRRIEHQLRAIEETEGARASVSWCIQISGEMKLTVIGRPPQRVNLSSILMRRLDVLASLGGFDALRKGADSEFVERFRAHFGPDSVAEIEEPLALVQLTTGSLSRDDFRFLRTNPARLQFMSAFRHWHAQLDASPDDAFLPPGVRGPFPAPAYLLGQPPTTIDLDVAFLTNLTDGAPGVPDLAAELTALTEAGLRVGVVECLAPFDLITSVRQPSGDLAGTIQRGVRRVLPGEQVQARLLLLRDPASATAMPEQALSGIRASRGLVIADYSSAGGKHYLPTAVTQTLHTITGAQVNWLPATDAVAADLLTQDSDAALLPPAPFAAVPLRPFASAPEPTEVVVGLPVGAPWQTPGRGTVNDILEQVERRSDQDRPTTVITWGSAPAKGLNGAVEHLSSRTVAVDDFIRSVDIVVMPTHTPRGPHLSSLVVRALGAGRLLLVPGAYREHLGEAALYLDEVDLASVLAEWSADRMSEQRRRAETWVQSCQSGELVRNAILPLLSTNEVGAGAE